MNLCGEVNLVEIFEVWEKFSALALELKDFLRCSVFVTLNWS